MTVLTKKEIEKLIKKKKVVITPFRKEQIGPGSIDLTLSNEFRKFEGKKNIEITEKTNYKNHTKIQKRKEITLQPGEFINGITEENIKLPSLTNSQSLA